tara:strand:- start:1410 stop:1565 length:156 start_codon:yes stop_codon:yes gene_type:complete
MKKCTRCKEEKSLDNFYKYNSSYHPMCNFCKKEYNKEAWERKKEKANKAKW